MLESLLTDLSDLTTIGLVVGVGAVGAAGFSVLRFAPTFQGAIDSFGVDDDGLNKNYQPLTQIFYKFDHANTEQWLNWILSQDKAIQDLAFNKLSDYLKEPLEEIGAVTGEVVKAIVQFKKTESYYVLLELLRNSIKRWGQFKSINLFFEITAKGMIQLNPENGFSDLKEHIELIIDQDVKNSDVLLISMIKAIGTIQNPRAEVVDYYTQLVLNRDCSFAFRREVLEEIKRLENDLDKYNVYLDIMSGFLNATVLRFNDHDQKALEELFMHLEKYIEENKPEIWDILVQCFQKDSTAEILVEPLTEYIKYSSNIISPEQIASLLSIQEKATLDLIKESLISRFALTEEESKLIADKFLKEDLEFDTKAVSSEKSKKTKSIAHELLDEYHHLESIVTAHSAQLSKNEKRGEKGIATIIGNAEDEKLYLLRILAANLNHSFIYIDLGAIVNSNYDLTELKNKINNSKPCILYLTAVEDFILRDFNSDQKVYAKKLMDIITEVSRSPSIKVIASLGDDKNSINANERLKAALDKGSRGNFDVNLSIDRPDERLKRELINQQMQQISPIRENEEFDIEELITEMENCSRIELLRFLNNYLGTSLLMQGKLLAVGDYIQYQQTGKRPVTTEDDESEII